MTHMMQPRVELHSLAGITDVGLDQVAPGLERGEIFVVRDCLQAVGALDPLREMILDTLEEVAGPRVRAMTVARGLTGLHDFVPVDQLMLMNPLMKQRSRRLAAGIVAGMTELLGLGPDVHFEDTPNVRIFIPHDLSTRHEAALEAHVQRRGSGGELTLHPPHQDSRHFHPQGAINVWCAIDHVVEGNGMSIFPELYGQHLPFTQSDGGIRPDQHLGRPVTTDLAPGDALIFETVHVHGSTINQTGQTRFVISFRLTFGVPEFRSKPWYNYVRPASCSAEGPPPNPIDYSQTMPDRGAVTYDNSGTPPPVVVPSRASDGEIEIPSAAVPEGEILAVSETLCVARIDGKPVMFVRRCPHEGADLARGVVRKGQIMCTWHGLRINAGDGRSACRSLRALELVPCKERDGALIIARLPGVATESSPIASFDEHTAAIDRFNIAGDRFSHLLAASLESPGRQALERLRLARDAAVHALLAMPGIVIRARLEAPVSRLLTGILESGVRHLARTAAEEATFVECWRRLGGGGNDDAAFACWLAAIALSRHGCELIALQPSSQDLGWAEQFWLQCLLEALPAASLQTGVADHSAQRLPPLMAQVHDRIDALPLDAKSSLFKAFYDSRICVEQHSNSTEPDAEMALEASHRTIDTLVEPLKEANADREASHRNVAALTNDLEEANADREASHRDIVTLTSHLKEANADRDASHRNIAALTNDLKEANADREASHRDIVTLTIHLKEANADRARCHARIEALMRTPTRRLSAALRRTLTWWR
jgi:nitrite reductase/ring-hydroxylating ferredoxin subunit